MVLCTHKMRASLEMYEPVMGKIASGSGLYPEKLSKLDLNVITELQYTIRQPDLNVQNRNSNFVTGSTDSKVRCRA